MSEKGETTDHRATLAMSAAEFRARQSADRAAIDEGPWSDAVKEFAKRRMAGVAKDLPARLDFVAQFVPVDVLVKDRTDLSIGRLLNGRLSFLNALRREMGQAAWEDALRDDSDFAHDMAGLEISSDNRYGVFKDEHYEVLSGRAETPLELADDTSERRAEAGELREMLRETGFDAIAKELVTYIRVLAPERPDEAHGLFQNATGEAEVWANGNQRFMMPAVVFHEVGHALDKRLKNDSRGQEWMDRYTVSASLRPQTTGWYADSYTKSEQLGRSSARFLMESFAEDFRHYWIDQDSIPSERRKLLDEIMEALFANIDRDDLRVRIRKFLRAKYDVGPEQVKEPTDCRRSDLAAMRRVQEAHKQAEEYAARQTAKKAT